MPSQPSTDAIWTHLSSDLRRFIRRRVSDDHVADDLLQETFVRVHRNIGTLQEADRLAAWVYRIARNVIHDHHRKATSATVALADADPADDADDRLGRLRCRACEWLDEMVRSAAGRLSGGRAVGRRSRGCRSRRSPTGWACRSPGRSPASSGGG